VLDPQVTAADTSHLLVEQPERYDAPERDADHGLEAAHERGDAALVADIVDQWGVDLAHSPSAGLLYEATVDLPLELAATRPGLAFRFEDIGRLPIGTTTLELPATPAEARAEFARNGDLRLRQALLPLATRRRLGRFDEALRIVEAATPLAEASVYPFYGDKSRILPYWYLQAGITANVAGRLDTARRHYLSAWTHRNREPYGFVARGIAVNLSLLDAFTGDHTASATWRERAERAHRRDDLWVDRFARINTAAAGTIQALDRLDPQVASHLAGTPEASQRSEQWPVFLWLFVEHALTSGDIPRATRALDDALEARPAEMTDRGLAAAIVPLVRAQIHLAKGQGQQALAEIAEAPDAGGLTRALRARTFLLAGEATAALTATDELAGDSSSGSRALTDGLLIAAAAHLALGDRTAAITAAEKAVARVSEQETPRLLTGVPREALTSLAGDVPGLEPLLALLDERGVREVYPQSVQLISVTDRESELLRDLGSGRKLEEIAEARFVSVNTIRTHLANLRRKLDARSRDEVVRKARLLGLLD